MGHVVQCLLHDAERGQLTGLGITEMQHVIEAAVHTGSTWRSGALLGGQAALGVHDIAG